MAINPPTISGVIPSVNDTDVQLKPTVQVIFGGGNLIDPLTWGARSFVLYGPGDVVLESGPGTILNSGLEDAPYPLLDGPLRRDKIEGTYDIHISGHAQASGIMYPGYIGGNNLVIGLFTPDAPLNAMTEYTAVLLGHNSTEYITSDRRFPGITTFTSPSGFISSAVSGFIVVTEPYNGTLQTSEYDSSTGQNDTYTVTITSGTSAAGVTKYTWSKASSPGSFASIAATDETQTFGHGLHLEFVGSFNAGETFTLPVFIPIPLAETFVWKFHTGQITEYATPPVVPQVQSIAIDNTVEGGHTFDSVAASAGELYVVSSWPPQLDYDVSANLPYIQIEFNKELQSGVYIFENASISTTPLLGLPVALDPEDFSPSLVEASGRYLTIWL